jgi:putative membrane protein
MQTQSILASSIRGLDDFLLYLSAAIVLLALFIWIYIHVTPYREIRLIREGNVAAACGLSGAMLGFVIPLASAIAHSVAFVDMLLWGVIALVTQIVAFMVARLVLPGLAADIPAGRTASGLFIGALGLAVGILNAASMSY